MADLDEANRHGFAGRLKHNMESKIVDLKVEEVAPAKEERESIQIEKDYVHPSISEEATDIAIAAPRKSESDSQLVLAAPSKSTVESVESMDSSNQIQ